MSGRGIPVTVVGGYLGAGKTTIISELLAHSFAEEHQLRIAVLVNDFGDVNIDASRIARQTDDIIELANGCVCCSLIDGFVETLDTIAAWPEPPDHLVIEPSGVADPMSVAQYAYLPGFQLAGVAVAVDADALPTQLTDKRIGPSIRRQVERGDLVLLTKTDLASEATLATTRSTLATLTDGPIVEVTEGQLDPAVLLGLTTTLTAFDATEPDDGTAHHPLASTLATLKSIPVDGKEGLQTWLESAPPSVVRAKGSVFDKADGSFDIDLVGNRVRVTHRPSSREAVSAFIVLAAPGDAAVTEWLADRSLRSDEASQSSTGS